jgi:hypothetical protein
MTNTPEKLEIKRPLLYLLLFSLVIGVIFLGLTKLSDQRREDVYQKYASETESYIHRNRDGMKRIFTEIFPDKMLCDNYNCVAVDTDYIPKLISQDLKDWSSTLFLKESGGEILALRLSGDYWNIYIHPQEKKDLVLKLLRGEVAQVPWDDYTYEFSQKEIIIPVKDESGKVMGAIMRGVIE